MIELANCAKTPMYKNTEEKLLKYIYRWTFDKDLLKGHSLPRDHGFGGAKSHIWIGDHLYELLSWPNRAQYLCCMLHVVSFLLDLSIQFIISSFKSWRRQISSQTLGQKQLKLSSKFKFGGHLNFILTCLDTVLCYTNMLCCGQGVFLDPCLILDGFFNLPDDFTSE